MSRKRKQGYSRATGQREVNYSSSAARMLVSFEKLDDSQPGIKPESFELWQQQGLLAALMDKIRRLNQLTLTEAKQQGIVTVYGDFPSNSKYYSPKHISDEVRWGVIKNIGGQKHRVAGYFEHNIFYCVFLDKDHQFWPTSKKNT